MFVTALDCYIESFSLKQLGKYVRKTAKFETANGQMDEVGSPTY